MKNSVLFFAALLAAAACASSCNKNNSNLQTDDSEAAIRVALVDARCPVYCELDKAKGGMTDRMAAMGILIERGIRTEKASNQDAMPQSIMIFLAFNQQLTDIIPDALYIRGNDGELLMIENLEMVRPDLAVGEISVLGGIGVLPAEPLRLLTENVDGASDNKFLVDFGSIHGMGQDIAVRSAAEVENNLEKFADKAFMRMYLHKGDAHLISIEQVKKIVSDGPEEYKFSLEPLEPLVGRLFWQDRSIVR